MKEERCCCGARLKHKGCVENEVGGKMCVKEVSHEQRLLKDSDYRQEWLEDEVRKSSEWFSKQLEK